MTIETPISVATENVQEKLIESRDDSVNLGNNSTLFSSSDEDEDEQDQDERDQRIIARNKIDYRREIFRNFKKALRESRVIQSMQFYAVNAFAIGFGGGLGIMTSVSLWRGVTGLFSRRK
mmetsp:Transcript_6071/g.8834  ORF Transcript_6071/g.8834 Transcript_6071/m.8834 type:complete len:120 (+) Transcript_6071:13-372(+)